MKKDEKQVIMSYSEHQGLLKEGADLINEISEATKEMDIIVRKVSEIIERVSEERDDLIVIRLGRVCIGKG